MMMHLPDEVILEYQQVKGKVLHVLNSATCHDGSLGSGSIAPHILDISTGER
jgi:hypothetical protein